MDSDAGCSGSTAGTGRTTASARLVCEVCGAIGTAPNVAPDLDRQLATSHGFVARSAEVTVFGRCDYCRG